MTPLEHLGLQQLPARRQEDPDRSAGSGVPTTLQPCFARCMQPHGDTERTSAHGGAPDQDSIDSPETNAGEAGTGPPLPPGSRAVATDPMIEPSTGQAPIDGHLLMRSARPANADNQPPPMATGNHAPEHRPARPGPLLALAGFGGDNRRVTPDRPGQDVQHGFAAPDRDIPIPGKPDRPGAPIAAQTAAASTEDALAPLPDRKPSGAQVDTPQPRIESAAAAQSSVADPVARPVAHTLAQPGIDAPTAVQRQSAAYATRLFSDAAPGPGASARANPPDTCIPAESKLIPTSRAEPALDSIAQDRVSQTVPASPEPAERNRAVTQIGDRRWHNPDLAASRAGRARPQTSDIPALDVALDRTGQGASPGLSGHGDRYSGAAAHQPPPVTEGSADLTAATHARLSDRTMSDAGLSGSQVRTHPATPQTATFGPSSAQDTRHAPMPGAPIVPTSPTEASDRARAPAALRVAHPDNGQHHAPPSHAARRQDQPPEDRAKRAVGDDAPPPPGAAPAGRHPAFHPGAQVPDTLHRLPERTFDSTRAESRGAAPLSDAARHDLAAIGTAAGRSPAETAFRDQTAAEGRGDAGANPAPVRPDAPITDPQRRSDPADMQRSEPVTTPLRTQDRLRTPEHVLSTPSAFAASTAFARSGAAGAIAPPNAESARASDPLSDPILREIAGGADLSATAEARVPNATGGPPDTARAVMSQIAAQVTQPSTQLAPGGSAVGIELAPAELGRVRISLTGVEAALQVSIVADRPETQDLMRRHIDMLRDLLDELGYDNARIDLGRDQQSGRGGRAPPVRPDREPESVLDAAAQRTIAAGAGLDLRL